MSRQEQEATLTLKDRINFPYILANQILTFQKSILATEYSAQEIRESIEAFVHVIPNSWKDEQFKKDLEDAKIIEKEDLRPMVAANIRMSEQACKELGLPLIKETKAFDYYKVFQACLDLLDRKKMLSKIYRVEELEGIDLDNPDESTLLESNVPSE